MSLYNNRVPNRPRNGFTSGADITASVLAFASVFVFAPQLYSLIIDSAQAYAIAHFGYGYSWLVVLLVGAGCGFATFGIAKMVLAASLRLGFAALAGRLFR